METKSNTGLIIGIVIAVAALAVGGYFLLRKPKEEIIVPKDSIWTNKAKDKVYDAKGNVIGTMNDMGHDNVSPGSYYGDVYDYQGNVVRIIEKG